MGAVIGGDFAAVVDLDGDLATVRVHAARDFGQTWNERILRDTQLVRLAGA